MGSIPQLLEQFHSQSWQSRQFPLFESLEQQPSAGFGSAGAAESRAPNRQTAVNHSLNSELSGLGRANALAVSLGWPLENIVAAQEDILGGAVIAHPLELAARQIQAASAISTLEAIGRPGRSVRVAGMRQTWRRGKNARGETFYFLSLEDLEGMLDVFIPGEVYRRYRSAFAKPGPWVVEGVIEQNVESGEVRMQASRVELLTW